MNIDQVMKEVYLNVIFNWATISTDQSIMNVLDIETNSMCRWYKSRYPDMRDSFIQAHVFTMLMMFMYILLNPISDPFGDDTNVHAGLMNSQAYTDGNYYNYMNNYDMNLEHDSLNSDEMDIITDGVDPMSEVD